MTIAKRFNGNIEFIPFLFDSVDEIKDILDNNGKSVDGWLLSGPLPFSIAKWYLNSEDNLVYCRITEAGLFKSILESAYNQNYFLENVSIDFIDEAANIEDMLNDICIKRKNTFIKRYSIPFDEKEVLDFHMELWNKKAITYVITTVPSVYEALKESGVPVYSIRATHMEIELTLELLIEKLKSTHFKNSQLGLQIIEICNYEQVVEMAKTPYRLQLLELEVKRSLLSYCQNINGYLIDIGKGRYEIFGAWGNIENSITLLRDTMEKISFDLDIPVVSGIGFGNTAFLAQVNANKAINLSKSKNDIIIVRDNGEIVEPLGEQDELSYAFHSYDEKLNEALHKANVGVKTYNKMRSIIRRMNWTVFSVSSLADQMGVTDRNVRRIISGLVKAELVQCVGEEDSGSRGRPKKIYQFID